MQFLTAIPIFNEAKTVREVLAQARKFSPQILVVDDGSSDGTAEILAQENDIAVVTHPKNRGYGAALASAFEYAARQPIDVLITMDCDGQHEPARIPVLLEAIHDADVVSGSRYLRDFRQNTPVPEERLAINRQITAEINRRYGFDLTDAFCGFKAYRREVLSQFHVTESGWGMPLQLWAQSARLGLRIKEVGVPRLYIDPSRTFGGGLDDPTERLNYYRRVLDNAEAGFATYLGHPEPVWTCREFCS